jgi:hypothetical protein
MAVKICERIKDSGFRRGLPAAKGERLCYFHKGPGQALPSARCCLTPASTSNPILLGAAF